MKKLLGKLFGGENGIIGSIADTIDRFVTTKEEKAKLTQEITKVVNEFHAKAQSELTDRLRIDMASDSWLSKNIRPLTLVFTLLLYSVFSITDGNLSIAEHTFTVNSNYIDLLGTMAQAVLYFYFGGRTIEKAVQIFRK